MEKNKVTVLIIVVGVLALLVGCIAGTLLGGTAVYLATTRTQEQRNVEPSFDIIPEFGVPALPVTPVMPDRDVSPGLALVTAVTPGSPAERMGIQPGDMIIRIDGQDLAEGGPAAMIAAYAPGDTISIRVLRGDRELEFDGALGENPDAPGKPWLGITYQIVPDTLDGLLGPDGDQ